MAKFRKKPVVIEAVQFDNTAPWPDGVVAYDPLSNRRATVWSMGVPAVETLEGWMRVLPGDWIITGVRGEKYPCKPDIFAMTYEPVE